MKTYYRRMMSAAWVLARIPYVSCVILTGSYAVGRVSRESDIDFLLVVNSGRIFTARFFAVIAMQLLGIKRSRDESKNHAGKVCLNYYLADNYLKIPEGRGEKIDKYCAQNYSQAKFVAGNYQIFEKFMWTNKKLFDKYHFELRIPSASLRAGKNQESRGEHHTSHSSFHKTTFGDWLEARLKSAQIMKIKSDSVTSKYPDLIVYNNRELRFHPPKVVHKVESL